MSSIVLVEGSNELNVQLIPIEVVPPELASVGGHITDTFTGMPVVGSTVYLAKTGQPYFAQTTSDAAGWYQLSWSDGGWHGVFARHPDYYDSSWEMFQPITGTLVRKDIILTPR